MSQKRKRDVGIDDVQGTETPPKFRKANSFEDAVNDKIKNANSFEDGLNYKIKNALISSDKVTASSSSGKLIRRTSPGASPTVSDSQQTSVFYPTISHLHSAGNAIHSDNLSKKRKVGAEDDIAADPHTPPYEPRSGTELRTPPSISTIESSLQMFSPGMKQQMLEAKSGVTVDLEVGDGEYVLKIKRRSISSSSSKENKVKEANQLAQNAGMLIAQSEMLRSMAEQMLSQYRALLSTIFGDSATRIDFTHQ